MARKFAIVISDTCTIQWHEVDHVYSFCLDADMVLVNQLIQRKEDFWTKESDSRSYLGGMCNLLNQMKAMKLSQ